MTTKRTLGVLAALLGGAGVAVAATFNVVNGDIAALQNAIITANTNGEDDTINLEIGVYTLGAPHNTTDGPNGLPVIANDGGHSLVINGNNAILTRSGNAGIAIFRIINIASGGVVTISALTISNGRTSGDGIPLASGAGIFNRGTLTLNNCILSGSTAISSGFNPSSGGGLFNLQGVVTLNNCTVFNNTARGTQPSVGGTGGGLYNYLGTLTVTGSTISANGAFRTDSSGTGGSGGGIVNADGVLTIRNSTVSGNNSASIGGGLWHSGTGATRGTIINSTFAGNSSQAGGAIHSGGPLTLINCTLTSNAAPGAGGGLYAFSSTTILNTIIAANNTQNVANGIEVYTASGSVTSQGHNFIGVTDGSNGWVASDITGNSTTGAKNPQLNALQDNGGPTKTMSLASNSLAINAGDNSVLGPPLNITTDQRGFPFPRRVGAAVDIGAFESGITPTTLANISTRLRVETGDDILIGGFIITGTQEKKVIIRAIGPSLTLAGKLENPTLELRNSAGTLLQQNDDWKNSPNQQAIIDSTIPPSNDFESAIVATLPANNASYTAIVRGVNNTTGIGVVEVYELDRNVDSELANISTRGLVQTGDTVLFAGTIVLGPGPQRVIIRAIGPSLSIAGKMQDPSLQLLNAQGTELASNDNWKTRPNGTSQQAEIEATTVAPTNDFESAVVFDLPANGANYTAIVRGAGGTTGIAVVEVYALN